MKTTAAVALFFLVAACAPGPGEPDVVAGMTEGALVPAIEAAAGAAEELTTAAVEFCASPTAATQEAAQQTWHRAKTEWERSELTTFFGPADMLRTLSKVAYSPISESGIDELLSSEVVIDSDYIENRAASTQRGLGAVEYALFRDMSSASDPRVCALTRSASEVVATETEALYDAWATSAGGEEPYADTFTGTMTSNQALGDVVGAVVDTLKRQSLFEIGRALGISAQEPELEAIPEGAAGGAVTMYVAQLEGIRALLTAGDPDSLGRLIEARSEDVADRIDELLERALTDLSALEGPMRSLAAGSPDEVEAVYDSLSELRTLFESDVVSLLDITLGFSDTDGDTG